MSTLLLLIDGSSRRSQRRARGRPVYQFDAPAPPPRTDGESSYRSPYEARTRYRAGLDTVS